MKKLFFVFLGVLFLSGCGAAARKSDFYEHNSMYKDWDHLKFSIYEYKHVDQKEARLSNEQDWWGIPVDQSK